MMKKLIFLIGTMLLSHISQMAAGPFSVIRGERSLRRRKVAR